MVIVDTREPKHIERFFKKKGWTVTRATLHAGDIADDKKRIRIERKHGTDLISSIYTRRLFTQCGKLFDKQEEEDCLAYLGISGDLVESVDAYENYVWKGLRKSGKKIPRKKFSLKISTPQIYKMLSMIPYHYDVNILWFITEEELLETIHYMLQEVTVSDPFKKRLSKRKAKKKKVKSKGVPRSRVVHSSNAGKTRGRGMSIEEDGEETEEELFRRLGLI